MKISKCEHSLLGFRAGKIEYLHIIWQTAIPYSHTSGAVANMFKSILNAW